MPVSSVYRLAFANVILLAASLVVGRVVYQGAFAYADSLNMLSPYPQLDAAGGTSITATSFPAYVAQWYRGLNGRWSQAAMNGAIEAVAKPFVRQPEAFPWWLMRSLSLFCIVATPLNFLAAAGAFGRRRAAFGAVLLVLAWAIWSAAQNTYAYSIWFDCLLTDRFVPMYLASLLSVGAARGWPSARPLPLLAFSALYLFVSVEQFLVTMPILLTAFAFGGAASPPFKRAAVFLAGTTALSAVSALIYFASPGQRWRNALMQVKAPDLTPHGISTWFRDAMPLGYRVLFGDHGNAAYWKLHLVVIALSLVALAIGAIVAWRRASTADTDIWRWALFAAAFHLAYAASLATLLVSPHFPEYAAQYPALLLALGVTCSIAALARLLPDRAALPAAIVCTAAVAILITLPALRHNVDSFKEEAAYGRLRKTVYHQILETNRTTGATGFVLTNSPVRSIGGTMEPPWGLSAYFRWYEKPGLAVVIDTNYDFAARPRDRDYVTIDLSQYWKR
jgi:hypothetical protein